jgi:tetratricopeptide (TPR) repeat protein
MATALHALALRAYQGGRHAEAADHCRALLRKMPDDLPALQMLGAIAAANGQMAEALSLARRAAAVAPDNPEAQGALGAVLLQSGDAAGALAPLERALTRQPRNAGLHNSRASALQALGRFAEALAAYDRALVVGPPHPEALLQRGHVLLALKKPAEALASFDKSLAQRGDARRAQQARGLALLALGRADDAAACFERVLALAPNDAAALINLAVACRHGGRDAEALALYDRVLARDADDPRARAGRAQLHLAHGRFAAGWDDHRWRQSALEHRGALYQERLAQDLTGQTIWLRKDQGLGDELFFLRFAPALKQRGARVIYQAGTKIAALLRRAPVLGTALDEVIDEAVPIPAAARVLSVGDLPFALGAAAATPPPLALQPRADTVAARLQALGPAPYIAVTWRAGTLESDALSKTAPAAALAAAVAPLPGTLLSVQRLPAAGETAAFAAAAGRPVHDLSAVNDDLEAMLALMAALDAYVAVSNTNLHLRAAVGRESHVLVPMPAEWRWLAAGDHSPWFPGSPIYRQAASGSWDEAFARLSADLISVFSRAAP